MHDTLKHHRLPLSFVALASMSLGWAMPSPVLPHGGSPDHGASNNAQRNLGEIEADEAIKACNAFLKRAGITQPAHKPFVRLIRLPIPTAGSAYLVVFAGESSFSVDAGNGGIIAYTDTRRTGDAPEPDPKGRNRLDDTGKAREFARALATKLGIPENWCQRFEDLPDETARRGRPMPARFSVRFEPTVSGVPLPTAYGGLCSIVICSSDGTLSMFVRTQTKPFKLESNQPRVTLREARDLASEYAKRFRLGMAKDVARDPPRPTSKRAELRYVRPNGAMDAPRYDPKENPVRLRLAWVLYYPGNDELWIDAVDGKVLGGVSHNTPNRK